MIERTKWVDRNWNFDFPAGLFPNILARLKGTPARLEEIVGETKHEQLISSFDNGWSMQENIGHLLDLEELHIGRLDDFINGAEVLRPADMENKKTYAADHNLHDVQDILTKFRETRLGFISQLEKLDDAQVVLTSTHPRLEKPMRLVDMLYFAAEHDDHHITTMYLLKSQLKA